MDMKVLDLFNVTCTSAIYEANNILCYVFCEKNYSLQFVSSSTALVCSPVRPPKAIKSNLLFQAGLTPKMDRMA